MAEQQNNNMNGLQVALGSKTVRATGIIALVLVLSLGPVLLTLYVNYKLVEAIGLQTNALREDHRMLDQHSEITHKVVADKHDAIYEQLGEQTYILSLSNEQRAGLKLMMPPSLCKRLEKRNC